jgi:hypothetical protein
VSASTVVETAIVVDCIILDKSVENIPSSTELAIVVVSNSLELVSCINEVVSVSIIVVVSQQAY